MTICEESIEVADCSVKAGFEKEGRDMKGAGMADSIVLEGIDMAALADAVASRLAEDRETKQGPGAMGGHGPHPKPAPHGRVVPLDPKSRNRRVRFDEDELEAALSSKGLGCVMRKVVGAPVEVKLVMALLLGVGLEFDDIGAPDLQMRSGFDNPLIADSRIGAIASHFGIGADRLGPEVANAPGEMLAVLLAVADLCLGVPGPSGEAADGGVERDCAA